MIAKPAAMPGIWGARKARPPASSVNSKSAHSRLSRIAPGWCSGNVVVDFAPASSRAIGGFVSARRPRRRPISAASTHQPTASGPTRASELCAAASTVTAPSAVAAPALSRTVVLRKSTKRTGQLQQRLEQTAHTAGAVEQEVGLRRQLRGSFVGADRRADRGGQGSFCDERAQSAERIQVGGVVADIQRGGHRRGGWALKKRGDAETLVQGDGWTHLQHLASPVDRQALLERTPRDLSDRGGGGRFVRRATPVECGDRVLVLAAH